MNTKRILKEIRFAIFILLAVIYSCSTKTDKLENDKILLEYFSPSEIEELKCIIYFFEQNALENCPDSLDKSDCYPYYLEGVKLNLEHLNGYVLGIDTVHEFRFIDSIKSGIFNDIWCFGEKWNSRYKERYIVLDLKQKSKYMSYLNSVGLIDSSILEYYNMFIINGSIYSPHINSFMTDDYEKFNFESERARLVFAIHYLTRNYRRRIKY